MWRLQILPPTDLPALASPAPPLAPLPRLPQRDPPVERVFAFVMAAATVRPPGFEADADEFAEALLGFALELVTAKDKAVRFRACHLMSGVMNNISDETEASAGGGGGGGGRGGR